LNSTINGLTLLIGQILKDFLVSMAVRQPGKPLASLWQDLPSWSHNDVKNMPEADKPEEPSAQHPRYGLTNDLQLYMTCPRQFQFFRTYNFTPTLNRTHFSGQLVRHTLEHIHRMARDGKLEELNEEALTAAFERKFQALTQSYISSIDSNQKTLAWQQILRYFQQN
jgi:DNA helicase-2/ATP-dependent DNA helicase PcrA